MKLPASLVASALATPALGFLSWLKTEEAAAYTPCDSGCFSEARCCPGVLEAVHPDDCFLRTLLGLHLPLSSSTLFTFLPRSPSLPFLATFWPSLDTPEC